ncbi:MAG: hypothetical protein EP348_00545 [Alphaproteobacteria bacterium]|nr:MAG: hypothetical protein EP348_00545 [Alphaproteobacteria bacterium]
MPFPMMLAGGLVLIAAFWDIFSRRIPNLLSVLIALLYLGQAAYMGQWADIPWHLLCGAGVLAVGIVIFSLGWLGGGDVKLLAALALWAGPKYIAYFLAMTCLCGGILAIIFVVTVYISKKPIIWLGVDWLFLHVLRRPAPRIQERTSKQMQLPYGVAIAAAGFAVFAQAANLI